MSPMSISWLCLSCWEMVFGQVRLSGPGNSTDKRRLSQHEGNSPDNFSIFSVFMFTNGLRGSGSRGIGELVDAQALRQPLHW